MAERKTARWIARGAMLVSAALPLLAGAPWLAVMLLCLPALTEWARERGERMPLMAATALLALGCWQILPGSSAWPGWVWCAICAGMAWRPDDQPLQRGAFWAAATAVTIVMGLTVLNRHYAGQVFEGLAWDAVQWISGRENGAQLLLGAYQSGLAGLPPELAVVPALNLFGKVVMLDEVRLQLMYSLRTTLTELLTVQLPSLAVDLLAVNALIGLALPEHLRRRAGQKAALPTFDRWQLPQGAGRGLLLLLAASLLPFFTAQKTAAMVGEMCSAALSAALTVLGLCTLDFLMKRRGTSAMARRLWMAAGVVFVPMIPMLLGVADQAMDLRRLRHSADDEGGY